jgi:heme exporter protein D
VTADTGITMFFVWLTMACTLVCLAVVVVIALCRIAAMAAEHARRALEDEHWATIAPTRTRARDDALALPQVARLRSNR